MVVVPADWTAPAQPGPVIAIVAPDEASRRTLEVARKASEALEVDLILAHAIEDPNSRVGPYYTFSQMESMQQERMEADKERMQAFLEAIPLPPTSRVVSKMGDVRPFVAELAKKEEASLVFVTAHHRPLRERLLNPAVQADLAAHLPVPVALIADKSPK